MISTATPRFDMIYEHMVVSSNHYNYIYNYLDYYSPS